VNLDTTPYLANSQLPATNSVIAGTVCDGKNRSNDIRASNFVVDRALKSVPPYIMKTFNILKHGK
jgi:hypothetical protein